MKLQSAHITARRKKWQRYKSWPVLGEDLSPLNHLKYLNLSLWAPTSLMILVGRTHLLYKRNGKLSQQRDFRFSLSFLGGRREGKMKEGKDASPDFCFLDIPFLFSLTETPSK